mmetsp:Transcript_27419/g.33308  ORF Transcript_27419/g.33308 Transcript_27419/m.33308 type:complete len:419 (+) Transcript_27419:9848-11104(+)
MCTSYRDKDWTVVHLASISRRNNGDAIKGVLTTPSNGGGCSTGCRGVGCRSISQTTDSTVIVETITRGISLSPGNSLLAVTVTEVHGTIVKVNHEIHSSLGHDGILGLDESGQVVVTITLRVWDILNDDDNVVQTSPETDCAWAIVFNAVLHRVHRHPWVPLNKTGDNACERVFELTGNGNRCTVSGASTISDVELVSVCAAEGTIRVDSGLSGQIRIIRTGRSVLTLRESSGLGTKDTSHLNSGTETELDVVLIRVIRSDLELGSTQTLRATRHGQNGDHGHNRRAITVSLDPDKRLNPETTFSVVIQHVVERVFAVSKRVSVGLDALIDTVTSGEVCKVGGWGILIVKVVETRHSDQIVTDHRVIGMVHLFDFELDLYRGTILVTHVHTIHVLPLGTAFHIPVRILPILPAKLRLR